MTLNVELYLLVLGGAPEDQINIEAVQITEKISYRCLAQWMGDELTDYFGHNGNFISGTILTHGSIHIDIHLGGWIFKDLKTNKFFYNGNLPFYYRHIGLSRVIRIEDEPIIKPPGFWKSVHIE